MDPGLEERLRRMSDEMVFEPWSDIAFRYSALCTKDDSSDPLPPDSPDFHDDVNDHGEQVGPLVVVEGALRDDLSTKAFDGCSHHAALVEHASGQEKVAGSSTTTSNKWLAPPPELVQLLVHPLYNDQTSHDTEVQVANYLATYGAVHEGSSQKQ
ncbi:hypothetical protein HPB51_004620 [Rhipicephalus microplus]|uniref:Uncharacterized protein n=1 Tax=Rhipicephalus microplus TaxID=6941 RepID=A0A9J6EES2_RHIMP|nr:hypothetical protein HPB51_004620 [Rhipicephalus microplus]